MTRYRDPDTLRAMSLARHIARDAEDGRGTVIERDVDGRWTSVPVGREHAAACEDRKHRVVNTAADGPTHD